MDIKHFGSNITTNYKVFIPINKDNDLDFIFVVDFIRKNLEYLYQENYHLVVYRDKTNTKNGLEITFPNFDDGIKWKLLYGTQNPYNEFMVK